MSFKNEQLNHNRTKTITLFLLNLKFLKISTLSLSLSSSVKILSFSLSKKFLQKSKAAKKFQNFETSKKREQMRSRRKVNGGKIKESVTHVCDVLREYYGIGTITPELLRQSKLGRKAAVRFRFFVVFSNVKRRNFFRNLSLSLCEYHKV